MPALFGVGFRDVLHVNSICGPFDGPWPHDLSRGASSTVHGMVPIPRGGLAPTSLDLSVSSLDRNHHVCASTRCKWTNIIPTSASRWPVNERSARAAGFKIRQTTRVGRQFHDGSNRWRGSINMRSEAAWALVQRL